MIQVHSFSFCWLVDVLHDNMCAANRAVREGNTAVVRSILRGGERSRVRDTCTTFEIDYCLSATVLWLCSILDSECLSEVVAAMRVHIHNRELAISAVRLLLYVLLSPDVVLTVCFLLPSGCSAFTNLASVQLKPVHWTILTVGIFTLGNEACVSHSDVCIHGCVCLLQKAAVAVLIAVKEYLGDTGVLAGECYTTVFL